MTKKNYQREFFTCRRLRMLTWLKERGFIPCKTMPDVNNPRFNVWVFKSTPAFEAALDEYFESRR